MDSLAENSQKSFHIRSNSMPSKPHPVVEEVDEHLSRLKASKATSSSSSLCQKLGSLQDLHDCIDKLLLLPLAHRAFLDNKSVDDLLEGSLKLLDLCAMAKDALSQMKECTNELGFVLRRRRGDNIASDVQKYLNSQKMMKKKIHKALKGMKKKSSQKSEESSESSEIVNLLKETEAITYSSIESLLSFMAGPKLASKMSQWSLISKMMQPKRIACQAEDTNRNEVEIVETALYSITNHKSGFVVQVKDVQNSVRKLESCIHDLEDDLESLYRRLIKNRVSFLNILNH